MPETSVRGERYRSCVFRIESWYDDGTPEQCVMIRDDVVAELNPSDPTKNHFMICLVPTSMLGSKMGGGTQ